MQGSKNSASNANGRRKGSRELCASVYLFVKGGGLSNMMAPSYSRAWCCLVLALSFLGHCVAIHSPYGKGVRLDDVQTLTLHKAQSTTSRRAQPTPQLTCLGGPCEFEPETVQCENVGSDGMEVQWKCEADLPKDIKFAGTQVTCEVRKGMLLLSLHLLKGASGFDHSANNAW